jgi:hypothetical protein
MIASSSRSSVSTRRASVVTDARGRCPFLADRGSEFCRQAIVERATQSWPGPALPGRRTRRWPRCRLLGVLLGLAVLLALLGVHQVRGRFGLSPAPVPT